MAIRKSVITALVTALVLLSTYFFICLRIAIKRGKLTDDILPSAPPPPSVSATLPPYQQANGPTSEPPNNGGWESGNYSPVHPPFVSATPPPCQQGKGNTFRESNNGGPESLNHSPVSPKPLPTFHHQRRRSQEKWNLKVNNGRTDMPDL